VKRLPLFLVAGVRAAVARLARHLLSLFVRQQMIATQRGADDRESHSHASIKQRIL
jgi:hypothetical protein